MKNIIDLTNKRIVVVGASSGIGKQTAITLSNVGANVILVARNESKLREVKNSLADGDHEYFCADISEINTIENLVKKIVEMKGRLDGLVYSAGTVINVSLMQSKPEKVKRVFDVNFFGFFETVRQVAGKGRFNDGMRIVGISSIAALTGNKAREIYSASKGAMDSAMRCMAKELADKGICINTVAPAMTETKIYDQYLEKYGMDGNPNKDLLKRQYLGIASPQDIANAVVFLISPAARFITGITMPVDGGYTSG